MVVCRPSAHLLLEFPNGEVEGPGLPSKIRLSKTGRYVVGLASNAMAERIDAPFNLTLTLVSQEFSFV